MVYAFYATMGGFAADVESLHNALKRVTFSPNAILFLAKEGKFCRVNRNDIEDKSKANVLAKALVCVQVLWVAGQAIERKIAGYPVTLLEVHTLVHVACALIMYGLWFMKPLNVQDPTMIDFRDDRGLLSFMLQVSSESLALQDPRFAGFTCKKSGVVRKAEPEMVFFNIQDPVCINIDAHADLFGSDLEEIKQRPKIHSLSVPGPVDGTADHVQVSTFVSLSDDVHQGTTERYPMGPVDTEYSPASNEKIVCKLVAGQAVFSRIGPRIRTYMDRGCLENGTDHWCNKITFCPEFETCSRDPVDMVFLSQKDLTAIKLATDWTLKIKDRIPPEIYNPFASSSFIADFSVIRRSLERMDHMVSIYDYDLLIHRAPNIHGDMIEDIRSDSAYLATALSLIPAAYGCAHLGALNIVFPTSIERQLWKIASIFLIAVAGGSGVTALIFYVDRVIGNAWPALIAHSLDGYGYAETPLGFLSQFSSILYDWVTPCLGDDRKDILKILLVISFNLLALVYVSSRLYLVVESFISLRHVPIGVYQTPNRNFMSYIPHL
jgi:hypothetical protein